ncbi:MAG: GTP-binding protein [Acutalibacteraceae bacterium]
MTDFYLLTGFLGAGKTTFLKQLIKRFGNKKIALIINEFGKQSVDGSLLSGLAEKLFEVNNGSVFCACRIEQFSAAISSALAGMPDIIIAEASGLSDPTIAEKLLSREEYSDLNYKGAVCLIDAVNFHKVFNTAAVVKKQLAASKTAIVNKMDSASVFQVETDKKVLLEYFDDSDIFYTSNGDISDRLFEAIIKYEAPKCRPAFMTEDITQRKYGILLSDNAGLNDAVGFFKSIICESWRIKGFARLEGQIYLVDCTYNNFNLSPYSGNSPADIGIVSILSSGSLKTEKAIKTAMQNFPDVVKEVL